jgi:hypothetical protein
MREDPTVDTNCTSGTEGTDDNVVTLPNLMSGRLADLLAAASGAGQVHELRGELTARTAFQAVSAAWPCRRRKLRRTPAVLAVTTVATMMVATTGLAAATELPGPAGRAVQGIFGTVGVNIGSPTPSGSGAGDAAASGSGTRASDGTHNMGVTHGGCTIGGTATYAVAGMRTASCTITVPRHASASASATVTTAPPATAPRTSPRASASAHAPGFHRPRGDLHSGGGTSTVQVPVTLPGGGTSRGGNDGGGGSCGTTTSTTTTSTTTTSTTTSTTTTTDPSTTASGCGHNGGHHHGSTSTTTTTVP